MADTSGRLGAAYVELRADPEKLQQDLNAARTEVEREAAAMGDAADKQIGGGFEAAGRKIQDATSGVRRFQSAISSTVGIVTGLLGSLTAIVGVVGSIVIGVTYWERKQAEVQKSAEEAQKTYEGIRNQLDDQLRVLQGIDSAQVEYERRWAEIKKLQEEGKLELIQAEDILKRMNAVRLAEIDAQRKARDEERSRAEDNWRFARQNMLDNIQLQKELNEQLQREQAQREEEARQEREQREAESAKRIADSFASAMTQAMQKMNTAQTFQQNFAGPLEELLRDIRSDMQTLKFRGGGI